MDASTASISTDAIGLKPEARLPERDMRLLMVVWVEARLMTEEGEEERGVMIVDESEEGVL
jgi:hypothetical protein